MGMKLGRALGSAMLLGLTATGLARVAGAQTVTEFPIPTASSDTRHITTGPDGNLWFTEGAGNKVARITTEGDITEFPVPTAGATPTGIGLGPDGDLWFVEAFAPKVGVVLESGTIIEIPAPTGGTADIAIGPDGYLWYTEYTLPTSKITRIDTNGNWVQFPLPTAGAHGGIAAGPDGNLWFTSGEDKISRITTAGVVTDFPTPTPNSFPADIAVGRDGNLWFTEISANQIGRITTAGVVTEFPIPTGGSMPYGIAAGPDGNLWFAEYGANQIGRITTEGVVTEFPIPTANSMPMGIVAGPDGNLWFAENGANQIGRITTGPTTPQLLAVDAHAVSGSMSNLNGVLESGETVQIAPSWNNTMTGPQTFTGSASELTGPAGPIYTIDDGASDYGTLAPGWTGNCHSASGDCYLMTVAGARPAAHWDASFTEVLSSNSVSEDWTLHVGESFSDVPASSLFYGFIENLFHNGITGGCGAGHFCPSSSVTRAQMAAFLMKSKLGPAAVPPPATGTVFLDVPASHPFAAWIEQLAGFQITGGCDIGGNYCPDSPVTRAQMAVFLLKSKYGFDYEPPPCTGTFNDVSCPSPFAFWIEQLAVEGITLGCGGGNYCPNSPNTRGQMAVFLVKTFGLVIYRP